MIEWTSAGPSVLASFMASAVAFVETRHRRRWRLLIDDALLAVGILMWTVGAWGIRVRHPVVSSAGACLLFAAGMPLLLSASALRRASASATQL